jgi:hypothetical protein
MASPSSDRGGPDPRFQVPEGPHCDPSIRTKITPVSNSGPDLNFVPRVTCRQQRKDRRDFLGGELDAFSQIATFPRPPRRLRPKRARSLTFRVASKSSV